MERNRCWAGAWAAVSVDKRLAIWVPLHTNGNKETRKSIKDAQVHADSWLPR